MNFADDTVTVLINDGLANFSEHADSPFSVGGTGPRAIVAADFDDDGDNDLAVANRVTNDVTVLINDGTGTGDFQAFEGPFGVGQRPLWLTVADLDGDGDPDLATANRGSDDVSVLLNTLNTAEVIEPTAGAALNPGQTIDIEWTTGFRGNYVRIQLWKGGKFDRNISNGTENDGSFSWTVPASQSISSDYSIKVFSLDCHSQASFSEPFAIGSVPPPGDGPTVTFPDDPGLSFSRGDTITVTYEGFPGSNVKIQLWRGATKYETRITASGYTANTGSFEWTIPTFLRPRTSYFIKVKDAHGAEFDFSDNPFEIK